MVHVRFFYCISYLKQGISTF